MSSVRNLLTRRELLKLGAAGVVVGYSQCGWLKALAQQAPPHAQRRRSCILLWLSGGPSTIDLVDMKPGHRNGGPFRPIATSVPGIHICEYLPRVARNMQDIAIIRSMSTPEGEHREASVHLRTGYRHNGAIRYPELGALVAKEMPNERIALPNYVAICPDFHGFRSGPGFLGPRYAPLIIRGEGDPTALELQRADNTFNPFDQPRKLTGYGLTPRIPNLEPPKDMAPAQVDRRIDFLMGLEKDFVSRRPGLSTDNHVTAYEQAVRLMRSDAASAFNLDEEPPALRERYGRNQFGQGCLLARRLVERGMPFVEVGLGGQNDRWNWDTHFPDHFPRTRRLAQFLDPAWGTLMEDLRERGLLRSTLIVCMGEFGRTPKINPDGGRDHWSKAFSVMLAGGDILGGQTYGQTSSDGTTVESAPTSVKSLMATVWRALGIDHTRSNLSNFGAPIPLAESGAVPIKEIVGS